mmetsp:Transcript_107/g.204  ORF Transcript_107/g.204 Transcript_107/m.204 type:complete len:123 (+) Transcript_107:364-732(+)
MKLAYEPGMNIKPPSNINVTPLSLLDVVQYVTAPVIKKAVPSTRKMTAARVVLGGGRLVHTDVEIGTLWRCPLRGEEVEETSMFMLLLEGAAFLIDIDCARAASNIQMSVLKLCNVINATRE